MNLNGTAPLNSTPDLTPHRLTLRNQATGTIVFDGLVDGYERVDPTTGLKAFIHQHSQVLEDLHELFPEALTASWYPWPDPPTAPSSLGALEPEAP